MTLQMEMLRRSRRGVIADLIRQQILTGVLRPGMWVKLADLASQYQVSVTPVREAVLQLADEGLVEIQTRKGIRILPITATDIDDLFTLYALTAGMLTERAIGRLSEKDVSELESLVEQMEQTTDPTTLEHQNWQFHRLIQQQDRSVYLRRMARMLARKIPSTYFNLIPEWITTGNSDHKALLRSIKSNDAHAARLLAEEHVRRGGKMLVAHLIEAGYWDT